MHKLYEHMQTSSIKPSPGSFIDPWKAVRSSANSRNRTSSVWYGPALATCSLQLPQSKLPGRLLIGDAHVAMRWISTEKTMPGFSLSRKSVRPVPLIVADIEGDLPLNAASWAYLLITLHPLMLNSWRASASADSAWCQCKVFVGFHNTCHTSKVVGTAFHQYYCGHNISDSPAFSVSRWLSEQGSPPAASINPNFLICRRMFLHES